MSEKLRSSHVGSSLLPDKPKNPSRQSAFVPVNVNGSIQDVNGGNVRPSSRDSTPVSQTSFPGYTQPNPLQYPPYTLGQGQMPGYGSQPHHGIGPAFNYFQPPMQQLMSPYWNNQNLSQGYHLPQQPSVQHFYQYPAVYQNPKMNNSTGHIFEPVTSSTLNRPPSREKDRTNSESSSANVNTVNYPQNGAPIPNQTASDATEANHSSSRGHTPLTNAPIPNQFSTPYGAYSMGSPQMQYPAQAMAFSPFMSPNPYYSGYDMNTMQMYDQWYKMYARAMRNMYYPYMKKSNRRSDLDEDRQTSATRDSVYSPAPSSVLPPNDNEVLSRAGMEMSPDKITSVSEEGRKTPERFPALHSVAKFSPNGVLLFTDVAGGAKNHLYVHGAVTSCSTFAADTFESFPGPLYGSTWKVPKTEIKRFILNQLKLFRKKSKSFQSCSDFEKLGDVCDFVVLLKYLMLLIDSDGSVDTSSVCDLLTDDLEDFESDCQDHSPRSVSLSELNETILTSPRDENRIEVMNKLTKMLLRGESKKFVELAIQEQLWGVALRFSQMMCPSLFNKVCTQFDQANVSFNDPLKTYINVKNSKLLSFVACEALTSNWKQHLAIILANCVDELQVLDYCVSLGDALMTAKRPFASQLCYLLAKINFDWPSTTSVTKLVLIGPSSPKYSFNSLMLLKSPLAVALTLIYEHCIKLSFPSFSIPFLQLCKLSLARRYFDTSQFEVAFKYCENIAINVQVNPESFSIAFIVQLTEMSFILSLKLSKTEEPWLHNLLALHLSCTGVSVGVKKTDNDSSTNVTKTDGLQSKKAGYSLLTSEDAKQQAPVVSTDVDAVLEYAQKTTKSLSISDGQVQETQRKLSASKVETKFPGPLVPEDYGGFYSQQSSQNAVQPPFPDNSLPVAHGVSINETGNPGDSNKVSTASVNDPVVPPLRVIPTDQTSMKKHSVPELNSSRSVKSASSKSSVSDQTENPPVHIPTSISENQYNTSKAIPESVNLYNPGATFSGSYASQFDYVTGYDYNRAPDNFYNPETVSYHSNSRKTSFDDQATNGEEATTATYSSRARSDASRSNNQSLFDEDDESDEEEGTSEEVEDDEETGTQNTTRTSSAFSSGVKAVDPLQESDTDEAGNGTTPVPQHSLANQVAASQSALLQHSTNDVNKQETAPPPFSFSYTQNAMPPAPTGAPNPFSRSGPGGHKMSHYQQYPNAFKVSEVAKVLPPPSLPTPQHMYEPSSTATLSTGPTPPIMQQPGNFVNSNNAQPMRKPSAPHVPISNPMSLNPPAIPNINEGGPGPQSVESQNNLVAPPVAEPNNEDNFVPIVPTFFNPSKFKSPAPLGPPMFPGPGTMSSTGKK